MVNTLSRIRIPQNRKTDEDRAALEARTGLSDSLPALALFTIGAKNLHLWITLTFVVNRH